jgi:phage-related protein
MADWGTVEAEPEIVSWLARLGDRGFGHAAFYIDLLQRDGPLLGEPHTRQLSGKLREIRCFLARDRVRTTYFIAPGRRIVLLTVFQKRRGHEVAEIRRALTVMERCIAEQHMTEDEEDGHGN